MKLTLKQLRLINEMTQKEAAEEIGVSVETWSSYERGKTFPDVPVIVKIEGLFSVSYNDIIFLPKDYGLTVTRERKSA